MHSRGVSKDAHPQTGLVALVYVSTARHMLTHSEVLRLLDRARHRNLEYAITGVLLYSDGNFMQYLEGPADAVAHVYDIICADPLHHGMIELLREPAARREFAQWSMGFRATRGSLAHLEPDVKLGRRLLVAGSSPACSMLTTFWNRGNGSAG